MIKVKSFTNPLKAFHVMQELRDLDEQVNTFIKGNNVKKVFSVSDTNTIDDRGATIGMIRVVAYSEKGARCCGQKPLRRGLAWGSKEDKDE
jgi:hypothetical protein